MQRADLAVRCDTPPVAAKGTQTRADTWRRRGARAGTLVLDAVVEVLIGLLSCALLGGLLALLAWGWSRHRPSTAGFALVALVALAVGLHSLLRRPRASGRLAAAAGAFTIAAGVWLGYVATYCDCAP